MKKNLLKEQYARLFKGKPMSNDASLLNEKVGYVSSLRGKINQKLLPGVEDIEIHSHKAQGPGVDRTMYKGVIIINGEKRPFKTGYGIIPHLPFFRYTDTNEDVIDPYTGKTDEKSKRGSGNTPQDQFWRVMYYTLAYYAFKEGLNRSVTDNNYTNGIKGGPGTHPPIVSGGIGGRPIKIAPQAAKSAAKAAEIKVLDYDDMREPSDNDTGYEGEIKYEGTYNGEKWTATQEFLPDGAIFTTVYDAAGENMEDRDDAAYDEINDAIGEYMEKEGLASE